MLHFFFLSCSSSSMELGLDYNIHGWPVSGPHPQSTVQPALSTLHFCTRLALIIHLLLHPFGQSVICTEWEQIMPIVLLLCWPSHSSCEVPARWLGCPFEKNLFGSHCLSKPLLPCIDQSMKHPEWEQIMPTLLTLYLLSRCAPKFPAWQLSSPFEKSPLGCLYHT